MTLATRAVRGTAFVLASSYTNMGIGVLYGIIMARLLEPDHFGVFALALFFASVFDLRSKLGLDYAFIHRHPTSDKLIATHWTLQMVASLLSLVLILSAGLTAYQFGNSVGTATAAMALAASMIIEAAGSTAKDALEKELNFGRSTLVITSSLLVSYLFAILLALAGLAYWALVGQVVVNATLGSIGFWWIYHRVSDRPRLHLAFDRGIARWMLRFGAVMTIGSIATLILLQFDNFLVGAFIGTVALGFYAQAYKVAQWPTGLVTHIVSRVSLPTYAKLQNDPLRLARAFELSLWLISMVATPLALAIFASAPDFLRLLYGDKWLPSAVLLRYLIGYSVLRPLLDDTGALFTALGRPKRISFVLSVQAITLVLFATPLTIVFGSTGTAVGVGIAFVIGIVLTYYLVRKTVPIELMRVFVPLVISAVGSAILYYLLTVSVDLNTLPLFFRVITKAGFIIAAYAAILLALQWRVFFERVNYMRRLLVAG